MKLMLGFELCQIDHMITSEAVIIGDFEFTLEVTVPDYCGEKVFNSVEIFFTEEEISRMKIVSLSSPGIPYKFVCWFDTGLKRPTINGLLRARMVREYPDGVVMLEIFDINNNDDDDVSRGGLLLTKEKGKYVPLFQ